MQLREKVAGAVSIPDKTLQYFPLFDRIRLSVIAMEEDSPAIFYKTMYFYQNSTEWMKLLTAAATGVVSSQLDD